MASRGKTTPKTHMYVADFETCDSDELSQYDLDGEQLYKQRVWLAGFKNLDTMESTTFNNLDDFMLAMLERGDNQNKEYAFHNLKFDGSYIVPWLLFNGYSSTIEKPKPKEFSVLVTERNAWYGLTIQVTKRRKVTLWDSAKLFPMKLEYLPELYNTPTKKLVEDQSFYERKRPIGHEPTEQELAYFENDLQVPAETINAHIDLVGLRFKKTQAGQAFYDFTQSFKAWKLRFPPLDTELDKEIRPAYWGGISHVMPHYASETLHGIRVMDINSSYPDKAAYNKLPYGDMLFSHEDTHPDMSKFWIADAVVEFNLKDKFKLPCIPTKAIQENRPLIIDKWLTQSDGLVRMTFNSIDYQTIKESYDFAVMRWIKVWHWKQRVHPEITAFIEKNNIMKVEAKKKAKLEKIESIRNKWLALSQRAKTTNNSFYGKFGEEVIKESKTPYLSESGDDVDWEVDKVQELTDGKKKYLPVAIAITAYGRQQLVKLANALGESFVYCDTDSVHFIKDTGEEVINTLVKGGDIELDATKLGAWDVEGDYHKARFLRAKCYIEEDEEGIHATVAGLPADPHTGQFSKKRSCLDFDNFYIGYVVPKEEANKLRTVRTETGDKLLPVAFTITESSNFLFT